ncbi:hypothetical protein QBC44DRAFT_363951 [Cladorrhinum sp. PSN332]|nr:hypothetical protein QBC44DRAFT_363951 [Cladorrhinum sp. PSN332]
MFLKDTESLAYNEEDIPSIEGGADLKSYNDGGSLYDDHHSASFHRSSSPQPSFEAPLLETREKSDAKPELPKPEPVNPSWPQGPIALKHPVTVTLFSVAGDLLLLFVWLALTAFAVTIARSHGAIRETIAFNGYGVLSQARIVIPTLFPIFFAATVGRCIRLISMCRVEHGERIGVLDRLLGSTTLMGTLITTVSMWSASLITAALLVVWTFSPLGSQASSRAFYWKANLTETPTEFRYFSSNNSRNIPGQASDRVYFTSAPNSMFLSTLVSPRESTDLPTDMWGNVKIPSIEAVAKTRDQGQDGWYDLRAPSTLSTNDYSLLVGVPIQRSAAFRAFSSLRLETSYWTLNCPRVGNLTAVNSMYRTTSNKSKAYWEGDEDLRFEYSSPVNVLRVWTYREQNISAEMYSPTLKPRRMLFWVGDRQIIISDCWVGTTYVETQVSCRKTSCAASKIRRSTKKTQPSPNYTGLDEEPGYTGRSPYLEDIVTALPGRNNYPSMLSLYIARMLGMINYSKEQKNQTYLAQVATARPADFAFFLSQALNTYWIAISGRDYVLDPGGSNFSSNVPAYGGGGATINFDQAAGSVWSEEPVFTCSRPWLMLLFISISIPLAACLVNLALTLRFIKGPHLVMNFSTLTRDNPFAGVPPGGSALSDEDRGHLLRNTRIRFGDVAGEKAVGHIAIGKVGDETGKGTRRLGRDKARLYE